MKVIEHISKAKNPAFSFEIVPPRRGKNAQEIIEIVKELEPFNPPFIDVTSHSAEAYYEENIDGDVKRRIRKKRPGTISICGIIQNRFKIDTVPHLLCRGFTREETEDAIIELNYLGIHNMLAIRGDETNYKKPVQAGRSVNVYASDLVKQMDDLRSGIYLDEIINADPLDLCIGVGGYPEKHFEAPNLKKDIDYVKQKVNAGADYIVTQMFFNNSDFFNFVKECRKVGIDVPIIPGLKIITNPKQLTSIPKNFYVNIPSELSEQIEENPEHAEKIGVEWCVSHCEELLNSGVMSIHFYIMNGAKTVTNVLNKLNNL
jgi:methylenetetrahydrofolate reductase (NADPH)